MGQSTSLNQMHHHRDSIPPLKTDTIQDTPWNPKKERIFILVVKKCNCIVERDQPKRLPRSTIFMQQKIFHKAERRGRSEILPQLIKKEKKDNQLIIKAFIVCSCKTSNFAQNNNWGNIQLSVLLATPFIKQNATLWASFRLKQVPKYPQPSKVQSYGNYLSATLVPFQSHTESRLLTTCLAEENDGRVHKKKVHLSKGRQC